MIYKAVIIGCGKIGSEYSEDLQIPGINSHAEAFSLSPDIELVGICDTDDTKLHKCQERWGVRSAYSNYQNMIRETNPDIISVCTPDSSHFQIITSILKESTTRSIIIEKPLATTVKEARKIISIAQKKNVLLVVNYTRRYAKNHTFIRDLIKIKKSIGKIQTISGFYSKGILHNGTHWIDMARFLIGEITSVRGINTRNEKENDPTLDAYFNFESGICGFLHGCDEKAFSIFEMDIVGTLGRIRILDQGNTVEYYHIVDDPIYSGYRALQLEKIDHQGLGDVLLHLIQDVVTCLNEGTQPLCSGNDGLRAIMIALTIHSSSLSNREERL